MLCLKLKYIIVETPRKFIIAELSIRKLGSSSVLIIMHYLNYALCIIISTDEDLSLRIKIIILRGVSTKLYFNLIFTMQTYKELIECCVYILTCYVRKI